MSVFEILAHNMEQIQFQYIYMCVCVERERERDGFYNEKLYEAEEMDQAQYVSS